MAGRYDQERYRRKYGVDPSRTRASAEPGRTAQDRRNDEGADFFRFLGDVAPAAAGVLGGAAGGIAGGIGGAAVGGVGAVPGAIGGAMGGAQLGAGLGKLGQGAAYGYADSLTADEEQEHDRWYEEEREKERNRANMISVLGSLRR